VCPRCAGQARRGRTCYRESLRITPNSALGHSNLGNALRALDRLDEAEQLLRRALEIQPKYPEAHNNLGIVLMNQGRLDEGIAEYDQALAIRPEYPTPT